MKKTGFVVAISLLASLAYAVTTNPASNVTADSDATANTIPLRNSQGVFSLASFTTAQIIVKTPTAVGELVFNSTLLDVCVSTGLTSGGYKIVGSTVDAQAVRACR